MNTLKVIKLSKEEALLKDILDVDFDERFRFSLYEKDTGKFLEHASAYFTKSRLVLEVNDLQTLFYTSFYSSEQGTKIMKLKSSDLRPYYMAEIPVRSYKNIELEVVLVNKLVLDSDMHITLSSGNSIKTQCNVTMLYEEEIVFDVMTY